MLHNWTRTRNRILQALYRPRISRGRFFSVQALATLDEIDRSIEDTITPLLSEFFKD